MKEFAGEGKLVQYNEQTFENIRHTDEYGNEYWLARELQGVLEYVQWRRFLDAVERAKLACKNSGYNVSDHFADVGKMIKAGKGAEREVEDVKLSRYACYLIVMNGDPRKEVIAVGRHISPPRRASRNSLTISAKIRSVSLYAGNLSPTTSLWPRLRKWPEFRHQGITQFFKTRVIRACMGDWGQRKSTSERDSRKVRKY